MPKDVSLAVKLWGGGVPETVFVIGSITSYLTNTQIGLHHIYSVIGNCDVSQTYN